MLVEWRDHPSFHREAGPVTERPSYHRDHGRRLPSIRSWPSFRNLPARCPGQWSNVPSRPLPGPRRAPPARWQRRLPMDHSSEQRRGGSCSRADPSSGATYRSDVRRLPSHSPRPSHLELRSGLSERNRYAVGSAGHCRSLIRPFSQGALADTRLGRDLVPGPNGLRRLGRVPSIVLTKLCRKCPAPGNTTPPTSWSPRVALR
jgi:hypothetical protein